MHAVLKISDVLVSLSEGKSLPGIVIVTQRLGLIVQGI
jgi:hypothetical protein